MNDNKTQPYTDHYLIDFQEALKIVEQNAEPVATEVIATENSLGRVLAQSLISKVNIPSFDNSAMDGYAVNANDLADASPENPIILKLKGLTAAGESPAVAENIAEDSLNSAWKIMTGAPVPKSYDSIIPVENTALKDNEVSCFSSPVLGAHVRRSGEDFSIGDQLMIEGQIINTNCIMALAALGVSELQVREKISVAVFSTGKELVDDPSAPLLPGQIRNSNKPFILEWFKPLPAEVSDAGTNFDNVEQFEKDLATALENNTKIIITSGAVSMGDFDFIPQTVKKLGGKILFHKCKIKPGKPILFAKFDNGSLFFGLPGNPISAAIGLRFFVGAAVRKLQGLGREKALKAKLADNFTKKPGFGSVVKSHARTDSQGQLISQVLPGQESFKIKPLIDANGWTVMDAGATRMETDELVDFYPSSLTWES